MPSQLQGSLVSDLTKAFLYGTEGDCTLEFIQDGVVIHTRKMHSLIANRLQYFAAQTQFSEGSSKTFRLNITSFYDGCAIPIEDFVTWTFAVLFEIEGRDTAGLARLDTASLRGVLRFRDFLGFECDFSLADSAMRNTHDFRADDKQKKIVVDILVLLARNSDYLSDLFYHFENSASNSEECAFHEACCIPIAVMNELKNGDHHTEKSKQVGVWLCVKFRSAVEDDETLDGGKQKFMRGFGKGIFHCIELFIECEESSVVDLAYWWLEKIAYWWLEPLDNANDSVQDGRKLKSPPLQLKFLEAKQFSADRIKRDSSSRLRAVVCFLQDAIAPTIFQKTKCRMIVAKYDVCDVDAGFRHYCARAARTTGIRHCREADDVDMLVHATRTASLLRQLMKIYHHAIKLVNEKLRPVQHELARRAHIEEGAAWMSRPSDTKRRKLE